MKEDNTPDNTGSELVASTQMAAQYGTGLNLKQVQWVGTVFAKSGMFKDDGADIGEAKAMVKIMAGQELGLAPFAAMNGINLIKGRPSMSGNLIAAAIKKHPAYDYRVTKNDDQECIIDWFEYDREGNKEKVGTNAFTLQMAVRAGLVKQDGNWKKYPEAMLFNRAISAGQKLHAPDVFMMPVYTPDEAAEIERNGDNGYIPTVSAPDKPQAPKKVKAEPKLGEETPADEGIEDANPPQAPQVEPEPNDEVLDEDERTLAKTVKPVTQEFKDGVKRSLEVLGLGGTERMKLLKEATGKITDKNLTDYEWRAFAEAVDDYAINMADDVTANETKVVNKNEGKNSDNTNDTENA